MILLLNIGNTSLWSALYDNGLLKASTKHRQVNQLVDFYDYTLINKIVIASVVPHKYQEFIANVSMYEHLEILEVQTKNSQKINFSASNYDFEQLGVDRMLVIDATIMAYPGSRLVCDFGTATTFNIIGKDNGLKGGMILPGIGMSLKVLANNTGQLPAVNKNGYVGFDASNSADNIRSGIILSQLTLIKSIVEVHSIETVILTGGNAMLMHEHLDIPHKVDRDLLLKGLVNFV